MVSTRGLRYKFSEGERVLCYEPDPTKAKVLYDSKVLEVIESKDKRGRRTVEYLIHFQGWNSSWDRCVSEDFVLKDTEENRQLQRDLAEKSQLQLGAYLYRRERKKGSSGSGATAGPAKRARQGFSDDGSSSSTQPEASELDVCSGNVYVTTEGETGSESSGSGSGSGSSEQRRSPPPNAHQGRAHIALPSQLRDRLTFDYHLVVKRGRLSRLPASPCAADILEAFVKWFARAGAWHPARAKHDPPQRPDLLDVSCRLNLVREVADGLRVYFDFVLRGHLLYKQELTQYHEICGQFIDEQEVELKTELEEEARAQSEASAEEDMKSPKIPEYSHLPPDPEQGQPDPEGVASASTSTPSNNHEAEVVVKTEPCDRSEAPSTSSQQPVSANAANTSANAANTSANTANTSTNAANTSANTANTNNANTSASTVARADSFSEDCNPKPREGRSAARSGNLARRLRSHKSAVSQSETEEPAPSTSAYEPRTFETLSSSVGSSGSSLSLGEAWVRPAAPAPPPPTRTPLSLLLDKVAKWQIIPREGTEHLPCRVYGAIHLARLFVKLPDFLNATQMPDFKLKMILKHIDMFVQYLDEHNEWFGEMYYVADNMSRSH